MRETIRKLDIHGIIDRHTGGMRGSFEQNGQLFTWKFCLPVQNGVIEARKMHSDYKPFDFIAIQQEIKQILKSAGYFKYQLEWILDFESEATCCITLKLTVLNVKR